jgi:hypothetical protein
MRNNGHSRVRGRRESITESGRLVPVVAAWLGLCAVVCLAFGRSDARPATASPAPERIEGHESGTPTLVVFLHPYCPCSKATLDMLDSLLRDASIAVSIVVYLDVPDETPWDAVSATVRQRVSAWRDVTVVPDPGARVAKHFGASASGTVLLYSTAGRLRFAGGVTPGRGRRGPSASLESLGVRLRNDHSPPAEAAVYGCALSSASDPGSS